MCIYICIYICVCVSMGVMQMYDVFYVHMYVFGGHLVFFFKLEYVLLLLCFLFHNTVFLCFCVGNCFQVTVALTITMVSTTMDLATTFLTIEWGETGGEEVKLLRRWGSWSFNQQYISAILFLFVLFFICCYSNSRLTKKCHDGLNIPSLTEVCVGDHMFIWHRDGRPQLWWPCWRGCRLSRRPLCPHERSAFPCHRGRCCKGKNTSWSRR